MVIDSYLIMLFGTYHIMSKTTYLPPSLPRIASISLSSSNQPSPPSLRHTLKYAPSISWNESGSKNNCASVETKSAYFNAFQTRACIEDGLSLSLSLSH